MAQAGLAELGVSVPLGAACLPPAVKKPSLRTAAKQRRKMINPRRLEAQRAALGYSVYSAWGSQDLVRKPCPRAQEFDTWIVTKMWRTKKLWSRK